MPVPDFDLAVIGAGAAGLSVAAGAAQLGASVALIERDRMGGDCLNTGCIPSKALLAAAHAARTVRNAARFGVIADDPVIDWDRMRTHIQGVIATIAPVDSEARFRALGATVLRGEARFTDPATISVDGRTITARRFVIAAGSRAAVPPIEGLDRVAYWTNDSLFDLTERPDHLLILGGGPIGLEMADAFSGLGCRVTVVEADRIAAKEDPELVDGLRQALAARGVIFRERTKVTEVAPGPVLLLSDGTRVEDRTADAYTKFMKTFEPLRAWIERGEALSDADAFHRANPADPPLPSRRVARSAAADRAAAGGLAGQGG